MKRCLSKLGAAMKALSRIRSVFCMKNLANLGAAILLIAASSVFVTSVYSLTAYVQREKDHALPPPSLGKIESRGLDVIAACMDRSGKFVVREFGKLRDDGLAPEKTLVDIGSITKTVTAIATLKLVEQGELELDETLSEIWDDVPEDKESITVHELLTHTSGLPDIVGPDRERLSREAFVNRVMDVQVDEDAQGEYRYSNAGYGLLAAIIELRSGESFEAFLRGEVLEPAGLDAMGYEQAYTDGRSLRSPRSWPTFFQRQPIRIASWGGNSPGWNLIGNGGLVATPVAYMRFWAAVRDGRIIDRRLLRKALTPHADGHDQDESYYGYGLMIQDLPGRGRVYWHDGDNDLFSSEWRDLSENGVILFTAGRRADAFTAMKLMMKDVWTQCR